MKKIHIIFGTHNSQPVGNSLTDMEQVYRSAYKPFISILLTYQDFPVTLYYSGYLLEWIEIHHPEFLIVLEELVKKKQVELLTGGFYEPILSMIPGPDRLGQIECLTTFIRSHLGKRPRGSWIAERVWEPSLASTLSHCGIEYIFLDDIHLKSSGLSDSELCYPYITEDQGKTIAVFALSKPLRHFIPEKSPEDVILFLENIATEEGDRVVSFIDDGEKFGGWNDSYKRCYEEKWLSSFISLIRANRDWIIPVHPSRYLKTLPCREKRYFPFMLNEEMLNWVRFPSTKKKMDIYKQDQALLTGESLNLSGGLFREFLTRYPDANLIYSKMIYVNLLVNQVKGDKYKKRAARQELWKGQSNHVYWHGKSGGIYINHLRKAVYRSLIESELLTRDKGIFLPSIISSDFDMDGRNEYLYSGNVINAYVHTRGGMLFELDFIPSCWNYLDTLSRYVEYYHSVAEQENGYDTYLRKAFIDHFLMPGTDVDSFDKMNYPELGDFVDSYYTLESRDKELFQLVFKKDGKVESGDNVHAVSITKKYTFKKSAIETEYTITNNSEQNLETDFGVEINLALPSIQSEDTELSVSWKKEKSPLEHIAGITENVSSLTIRDLKNNTIISVDVDEQTQLMTIPVQTISRSFDSIHRMYQHTCFIFCHKLLLAPQASRKYTYQLKFRNANPG